MMVQHNAMIPPSVVSKLFKSPAFNDQEDINYYFQKKNPIKSRDLTSLGSTKLAESTTCPMENEVRWEQLQ